jgi:exodeoxyribonuclease V beta subunit
MTLCSPKSTSCGDSIAVSRFNILDRNESIHRNLLLEASAGTGKTFAIENIVVRFLLGTENHEPMLIENILVVTFTRMAARELKERIHANLEKSLTFFKSLLLGEAIVDGPDYLLAYAERGNLAMQQAKKNLEKALFTFDKAQIFTIHGFCWRMLKNYSVEAGISLDASSMEDQSLSITHQMQVVRDFIRSELDPSKYSLQQLNILTNKFKRDIEKLQQELLIQISKGMDIIAPTSFEILLLEFQQEMQKLKLEFGYQSEKLLEDFFSMAPSYKELCDKSGDIYPEKLAKAERFAKLFDQKEWTAEDFDRLIEDGLIYVEAFDPSLLKVKAKSTLKPQLHYPLILEELTKKLLPLISEAGNEDFIFARVASDCRTFVVNYQKQEELFGNTDLLVQMEKTVEKTAFRDCVRNSLQAAIVDEFQDTDPIQWRIFSQLFAAGGWKGYLHLVGDPKQSIYAFRQADIYTYLDAAEKLGKNALATLDTNFRSQPSLINALNAFFSSASEPFVLPKTSQSLPYRNVRAGRTDTSRFSKNPSLVFWTVRNESKRKASVIQIETDFLLPAIVEDILNMHEKENVHFDQFAILIADRHQAKRAAEYLRKFDIPIKSQKGIDLRSSSVVDEMKDLLNGVLNYRSKSEINKALACRLVGKTHKELRLHEDDTLLFPIVEQFARLKTILKDAGFAQFYSVFMDSVWHYDGKTVLQRLLSEEGGREFYREWQDLADLLVSEEKSQNLLPQELIDCLNEFIELSNNDEDKVKAYVDPDEEGVTILTMHMSKGLEFDVVFALGLLNSKLPKDSLIPLESENQRLFAPVKNENDPRFIKHCEECDAEKMRQLYVALTRAREKLYVPFINETHAKEVPLGSASPIDLFVARMFRQASDYRGLYQHLLQENGKTLKILVEKFPETMKVIDLESRQKQIPTRKKSEPPVLLSPKKVKFEAKTQLIQSFTSLTHSISRGQTHLATAQKVEVKRVARPSRPGPGRDALATPPQLYEQLPLLDEDFIVPHDFTHVNKTEHTLPTGNETGVLLHKIFEVLPFDVARNMTDYTPLKPLIAPFLKGTAFVAWEDAIAKIVYQSLKTTLNKGFCLAEVDPNKVYQETEFFYPCDVEHAVMKEIEAQPGFMKGVVDLFFEYQGMYYLLDWKSNWLGPTAMHYDRPRLDAAMVANHYDFQAKIYYEAFKRYLKIFNKRNFEEIFGGVYYFFVRGVGDTTGILHYSTESLEQK